METDPGKKQEARRRLREAVPWWRVQAHRSQCQAERFPEVVRSADATSRFPAFSKSPFDPLLQLVTPT